MSKYGPAHGKARLTCGCFDSSRRRLITGASDGSIKIWNFSNGESLSSLLINPKDMKPRRRGISPEKLQDSPTKKEVTMKAVDQEIEIKGVKPYSEITAVECIFDPADSEKKPEEKKPDQIVAVGWDKRMYIWNDTKEQEISTQVILPAEDSKDEIFTDDCMSLTYRKMFKQNNYIYVGTHSGELFAINAESRTTKARLHEEDPSMRSRDPIANRKSVDILLILEHKRILVSGSADQTIRFWETEPTEIINPPLITVLPDFPEDDSLTALAATEDNNYLLAADTSGHLKMLDLMGMNKESLKAKSFKFSIKTHQKWYIQAHT